MIYPQPSINPEGSASTKIRITLPTLHFLFPVVPPLNFYYFITFQHEICPVLGSRSVSLCLLNDYFRWDPIDEKTTKATLIYGDISASAIFHFNDKGEIVRINVKGCMKVDGKFVLHDWEIPILEYRTFHGIKILARVDVVWKLEDGDFCYDRVEILSIEYNR